MAASAIQESLFSAPHLPSEIGEGPGNQLRWASEESPESYRLARTRKAIDREVILRNGSAHVTRFLLGSPLRSRNPTQDELASMADAAFLRSKVWPDVDQSAVPVRLADLFSSCGLMTLGAWEASRAIGRRLEPVLAVDINAAATRVYKENFGTADVRTLPLEEILDGRLGESPTEIERKLVRQIGKIDVLVGGPPCQGHSDLNNHTRRRDPKNKLYERMARFAEVAQPTHIVIENVSAVRHSRERVVRSTTKTLMSAGYSVSELVVEVSCLGAAQRRRRHILLASRVRKPDIARTIALFRRRERPASWAIADLVKPQGTTAFDTASVPTKLSRKRIDYLFRHELYDLPDEMRPDCHRLTDHSYKSVYGRMRWDEPAQTITSGFNCMGQGRFVHPKYKRTITPHEAARLQFIPDFFQFGQDTRRTALAEMIANAVPPRLTYVLLLELLR